MQAAAAASLPRLGSLALQQGSRCCCTRGGAGEPHGRAPPAHAPPTLSQPPELHFARVTDSPRAGGGASLQPLHPEIPWRLQSFRRAFPWRLPAFSVAPRPGCAPPALMHPARSFPSSEAPPIGEEQRRQQQQQQPGKVSPGRAGPAVPSAPGVERLSSAGLPPPVQHSASLSLSPRRTSSSSGCPAPPYRLQIGSTHHWR